MLTTEQLQALKADIAADPAFEDVPHNSDGADLIAKVYCLEAVPAWYVWKTSVLTEKCKEVMDWVEFIGLGVGERDGWKFMLSNGKIDPSKINVRQGIADIFSGPQGVENRTALIAIAKRLANRIEKLLSIGTGSEMVPATMTHEGSINYRTVLDAWNT